MRVVVTGDAGRIGKWLVRELASRHEVLIFAREPLADLLPRFYPGTEELAAVLTGAAPAVVSAKAKRLLGYQPSYSWRNFA